MTVTLHQGDAVTWALEYSGELFHALLCDAPYEMAFMGKGWDASGVAFDPETWRAFARVLHPGAFLFVFAGTINDDLISVAMREAGLRKYHKMQGWLYASGFPKATRIDTQIDKAAGAEREVIGRADVGPDITGGNYERSNGRQVMDITAPATPLAQAFAGHRYGLQALKPALETVLIFQKPYEGKPIENITATGAGALWIDGARIGTSGSETHGANAWGGEIYGEYGAKETVVHNKGRWASNFYLVGDEAARRLDEQSGVLTSGKPNGSKRNAATGFSTGITPGAYELTGYGDSGGASRFFLRVDEQIDEADPVRYCAKASRRERDSGLDGCEIVMIELHQNKHSSNEVQSWEDPVQKVKLLVATAQSTPKVIDVSCTEDVTAWNTLLFGNNTTAQYPMDGKSITVTKTNLITESRTLSWWMRSLTNAYTADASSLTGNGGSPAESVEYSNPSVSFINVSAVYLPGVGTVASGTQWTISASDAFVSSESGAPFNSRCANCGRLKLDHEQSKCKCPVHIPLEQTSKGARNGHPTIKPLALTRYLATLLLPPAEYAPRRIFCPFAGVASEAIGAMQAGWEHVEGVELTEEYLPIARARVEYWQERMRQEAARAQMELPP